MNATMFSSLAPILILSLTSIVLMIQASVKRDQSVAWVITAVGFALTLWGASYARDFTQPVTILLQVDHWSLFFTSLITLASLVILVLSRDTFSPEGERKEEYYLLLVLSVLGAVVLIQSSHMVSLLLGMELMGVALYAMIAFPERGQLPLEGAIKYLVLSACASAMLLYGFALIYAATGELSYAGIGAKAAAAFAVNPMLIMAGSAMVLALSYPWHLSTCGLRMSTRVRPHRLPVFLRRFLRARCLSPLAVSIWMAPSINTAV